MVVIVVSRCSPFYFIASTEVNPPPPPPPLPFVNNLRLLGDSLWLILKNDRSLCCYVCSTRTVPFVNS